MPYRAHCLACVSMSSRTTERAAKEWRRDHLEARHADDGVQDHDVEVNEVA